MTRRRIACLGWGSLIWDRRSLSIVDEPRPWRTDGPSLPIEFARQSYDGRMTLVIVPDGRRIQSLWTYLNFDDLDEARSDLCEREWKGGDPDAVVGVCTRDRVDRSLHSDVIAEWASQRDIGAILWTKLEAKFEKRERMPSQEEVISYLASLSGVKKDRAERYVRKTPLQIATPYREAIVERLAWDYEGSSTDPEIRVTP